MRLLLALSIAVPCLAFTAEDLLSAPRPQPPILSPDNELALNVVDEYDFKSDHTTRSLYLLNLTSSSPPRRILTSTSSELSEVLWLSADRFAYLNQTLLYTSALNGSTQHLLDFSFLPADLQYHHGSGSVFFTAQIWEGSGLDSVKDGDEKYAERGYDGEVFDDLFISVNLSSKKFKDHLSELDTEYYQKMDAPSYTLSSKNLAITIKPPHLNDATHTRTDILLIPLSGSGSRAQIVTPHAHGAISSAKFDKTGHKLAWLEMAEDGYEADQNRVRVKSSKSGKWDDVVEERVKGWEKSPTALEFSESILLLAEWHGRTRPFTLSDKYHELPSNGSITSIKQVKDDLVLLSGSSFTSPANSYLLNTTSGHTKQLTEWTQSMARVKAEEFWFTGADGREVMAWVMRPTGSIQLKDGKIPMAFLIHGGPQGAWEDIWSTRWNPALFAEKGYFVVAVNPTGSTGYGQEFTDRIQGEWGSRPFKDLLAGYHAALKAFPEIDAQRTAALGASYGGYMANWIQGHNDQFGFKAIVCHDGIFDTATSYYTTEEVWFPAHEFEGDGTTAAAIYQKWNPMNHVAEWSTPELVIHGGKDYRLVLSQGIAAFTALQTRGVPSRFLYFPNENHWVLSPKNSRKWHHEVFRWLDEWVGVKGGSDRTDRDNDGGGGAQWSESRHQQVVLRPENGRLTQFWNEM